MNKLLMLKLLMMTLATLALNANEASIKAKIIEYQKYSLSKNPNLEINKIEIIDVKPLQGKDFDDGWKAYTMSLDLTHRNRKIEVNEIIFSNGELISPDFIDVDSKTSIKERFASEISDEYYDKEHLVAGNIKAKHKLIIFSDPFCPACQGFVPRVVKFAQKHKNDVALFYYGFPLVAIHPTASVATKMGITAKLRGINPADIKLKIYGAKLSAKISEKDTFKRINKILGLKGKDTISAKDFNSDVERIYKKDLKLGNALQISGTPTLYTNGQKDKHRTKYLKIIK